MKLDTLTSRSPGSDSIDASDGGNVNVVRLEVGEKTTILIMALSLCMNAICAYAIYNDRLEQRLKQYDLTQFQIQDFAPLKAKVDSHSDALAIMQTQQLLNHKER